MSKKWVKRIAIIGGILLAIILLANFGINLWLKYQLPKLIKKNSNYTVQYEKLQIDVGTGNIFASNILVKSKNPANQEVIAIDGTLDTIKVSRFGIYQAIVNKRFSTTDLYLANPHFTIRLPKEKKQKKNQNQSPIQLQNIHISNGDIAVLKSGGQKLFSVKKFNFLVENLKLNEDETTNKLPFTFEKYSIIGENGYFRPNNLYAITAQKIDTQNGKLDLSDFKVQPLLSWKQFEHFYPNQKSLIQLTSPAISLTDIVFDKQKLSLNNLEVKHPELTIIQNKKAKPQPKTPKETNFEIALNQLKLTDIKINISQSDDTTSFSGENLQVAINKIGYNKETAKQPLPFNYQDFLIAGKNINFNNLSQEYKIASVAINPKSAELVGVSANQLQNNPNKLGMKLRGERLSVKFNTWKFNEGKLALDIQSVLLNEINGTIFPKTTKTKQKPNFSTILFPINIGDIAIKNSNITIDKQKQPLVFNHLNAAVKKVSITPKKDKSGLDYNVGDYAITTRDFKYKTAFYQLSSSSLLFSKKGFEITNFAMIPTVSRSQFIRQIPTERDLYTLKANKIAMTGSWDLISKNKFLEAQQLTVQNLDAQIFRSKIPKDDPKIKPLYSELLRKIKFPMLIRNLNIYNSVLVYEEDAQKSDGPGKLRFSSFNLNAQNLNSAKKKGQNTNVPITIDCKFFDISPMHVNWSFNTADTSDAFKISGNVNNLPASRLNAFVEPYLKIRTSGVIEHLNFNFNGNKNGIAGTLKMAHKNLKVAVLKDNGEKNKTLSAIANIFVRTNSADYPESVAVDNVKRDPTKSFFNLFWKGVELGLKKTLIGKNIEKTEKNIKNTIKDVKSTSQDVKNTIDKTNVAVKEAKKDVKAKVNEITKKDKNKPKKKLLDNVFGKKNNN